jgi:putative transposase
MRQNRDYLVIPNVIIHAFNRGVNRGQLFHCSREYDQYMEYLVDAQEETGVSLLVHSLMSNHVHMILQQHEPFTISRFMQKVTQNYAQWLNKRLGRTGHVFQGRYGGVVIPGAEAFLRLTHYIHMNPVLAKLASDPDKWKYSSCRACIGKSRSSPDNRSLLWSLVGGPAKYARFLEEYDPADPESAQAFLSPEAAGIWNAMLMKKNQKKIHR